jgi:small subunit ribosomal protein S13
MRLFGITIPDEKRVDIALSYVYGVGRTRAQEIVEGTKIDPAKRAKDLSQDEVGKIRDYIEKNFKIEGELRQIVRGNIARLKDIQAYRGSRHARRLPVRGQRTKTNSRTVRGNVRKRKVELK